MNETLLADLKGRAQIIYNTSQMKPRELREKILTEFSANNKAIFTVNVMSFGFKHGIPIDADLVFDVRFLPNPHYIDHMRPKTGLDEEVSSYVLKWRETQKFLRKSNGFIKFYASPLQTRRKSSIGDCHWLYRWSTSIGCILLKQLDIILRRIIIPKFHIVILRKERIT